MIAYLHGQVIHLAAPFATILTGSGVGYEVELTLPAFCQLQLNKDNQIWVYHHVREDAQLLYGFLTHRDREVFRQLIKVNGVGAKMALVMLSNLSVVELKKCVENDDEATLVRLPGVGKKTAQRLLIELKDKLKNIELLSEEMPLIATVDNNDQSQPANQQLFANETKAALISLGYKDKEAEQAIKLAEKMEESYTNTQSLLKATLKQLSK